METDGERFYWKVKVYVNGVQRSPWGDLYSRSGSSGFERLANWQYKRAKLDAERFINRRVQREHSRIQESKTISGNDYYDGLGR